jgi:hypothetical protein
MLHRHRLLMSLKVQWQWQMTLKESIQSQQEKQAQNKTTGGSHWSMSWSIDLKAESEVKHGRRSVVALQASNHWQQQPSISATAASRRIRQQPLATASSRSNDINDSTRSYHGHHERGRVILHSLLRDKRTAVGRGPF